MKTTEERMHMKKLLAILAIAAMVLAACGGGSSDGDASSGAETTDAGLSGDATAGEAVFVGTCASCHGPEALGLEGLGKNLHDNAFVDGLSDAELVSFLEVGRPAGDPANETGVDMPPKGGNPSLSEQDLYDVVAFLRTLD